MPLGQRLGSPRITIYASEQNPVEVLAWIRDFRR